MPALLTPGTTTQPAGGALSNVTLSNISADMTSIENVIGAGSSTYVPVANLDPQAIQYVSVTAALAAVQALHSVGIALVAAQGAGTLVELISCTVNLIYGSAAYSGGGAVSVNWGAGGTAASTSTIASSVFTGLSANEVETLIGPVTAASSVCLNKGLILQAASADFTSGTGGSAVIKCAYRVHTGLS